MSAALPQGDAQLHGFEGRTLGGFRLSREIACGGMATVYLAHKAGTHGIGQAAAVKVIHPHLSREREFVDMFLDEARIVSSIGHPNVCRVLDFGKAEGTYYLAMEFVVGETWADVLARMKVTPEAQPMIPAVLSQVLAQACEGLHAAHEARDAQGSFLQIVHRDISPQNLIVGYDGSVRVLDFGIASAAEKLHTTRNGTIKGRFAYMAPEQMRGHVVDRRADIWSLGVVLWEGLTQQRLFKRETEAETVLAVTHDALPSAHDAGHAVPAALARVASQALDRDREARHATAREMGLELSRYASSSLVPMGMPEVSMWMQRLFPEQIDRKRVILREAAEAAEASVRAPSTPPAFLFAQVPTVAVRIPNSLASRGDPNGVPSISAVREVSRAEPSRLRVVAAVALALSIAVVLGLQGRDDKPATSAAKPNTPQSAQALAAATPETESPPAAHDEEQPEHAAALEPTAVQGAESNSTPRVARRRADTSPTGTVSIATPGGWAEVYLGNKKLGNTPARFELPVGAQTLRLSSFGKLPELTRRVEVSASQAVRLKVTLE